MNNVLMLNLTIPRVLALCGLGIAIIFLLVIVLLYIRNRRNNNR